MQESDRKKISSLIESALKTTYQRSGFSDASSYDTTVRLYLERPKALDAYLSAFAEPIISSIKSDITINGAVTRPWLYLMLYTLIDVRGISAVSRLFPSDVEFFEPTLALVYKWSRCQYTVDSLGAAEAAGSEVLNSFAQRLKRTVASAQFLSLNTEQDLGGEAMFKVSFVLLSFLYVLVTVPFDIHSIDSSSSGMGNTLYSLVRHYVASGSKARVIAIETLAKFATRPDQRETFLPTLVSDANSMLGAYVEHQRLAAESVQAPGSKSDATSVSASIMLLSYIIRHSDRSAISCSEVEGTLPEGMARCIILRSPSLVLTALLENDSREIRRLAVVLATRLAAACLPKTGFQWKENLFDAKFSGQRHDDYLHELDSFDVPPEFDSYIDTLLLGLRDVDTSIRVACSKGLALAIGNLPKLFADEVFQAVVLHFSPAEATTTWHGACLALAEVIRHRFLLPERIPEILPILREALRYDRKKAGGAIVRDAACYVAWSLARSYNCSYMYEVSPVLACELLALACFDREINIRRAAAAAFQELAGRIREPHVPCAILCSAAADYFSLGSRTNSFLNVSARVCELSAVYKSSLLEALLHRHIVHWDGAIRDLAARALPKLLMIHPDKDQIVSTVNELVDCLFGCDDDDWFSTCGYLCTVSHTLTATVAHADKGVASAILACVARVTSNKSGLFSVGKRYKSNADGNSGIISATSFFISTIAGLPLKYAQTLIPSDGVFDVFTTYLLSVLEYSIVAQMDKMSIAMFDTESSNEVIGALRVLNTFYDGCLRGNGGTAPCGGYSLPVEYFLGRASLPGVSPLSFVAYLGYLPTRYLQSSHSAIMGIIAAGMALNMTPATYVFRLHAISSVKFVLLACPVLSEEAVANVSTVLRAALSDYSSDQRGDIGSLVRLKALRDIRSVLVEGCSLLESSNYMRSELVPLYTEHLVIFLGSRIDIIRTDALVSLYEAVLKNIVSIDGLTALDLQPYVQEYEHELRSRQTAMYDRLAQVTQVDNTAADQLFDFDSKEEEDTASHVSETSVVNHLRTLSTGAIYVLGDRLLLCKQHQHTALTTIIYAYGSMAESFAKFMMYFARRLCGVTLPSDHKRSSQNMDSAIRNDNPQIIHILYKEILGILERHDAKSQYSSALTDSALSLTCYVMAYGVFPSPNITADRPGVSLDAFMFEFLGKLLSVARVINSIKLLDMVCMILSSACQFALRSNDALLKTFARSIKGLILMIGHKITKVRATAANAILECFCLRESLGDNAGRSLIGNSDDTAPDDVVAFITSTDWTILSAAELAYARTTLCGYMHIDPPPQKKSA